MVGRISGLKLNVDEVWVCYDEDLGGVDVGMIFVGSYGCKMLFLAPSRAFTFQSCQGCGGYCRQLSRWLDLHASLATRMMVPDVMSQLQ